MLRICPREQTLIKALHAIESGGVQVLCDKVLGTGDISIHVSQDAVVPFAVLERKTHADLVSSVKDGRYTTQTDRLKAMMESRECHVAGYILEGPSTQRNALLLRDVRDSIQLQHRLLLWDTSSVDETAEVLMRIAKKCGRYEEKIKLAQTRPPGVVGGALTGSYAKKGNLRTKFFFQHQLMLVPGVSTGVAQSICNEFQTLQQLLDAWSNCTTIAQRQSLLATLPIHAKRQIGPKLSSRIHDLFLGVDAWTMNKTLMNE